jgi:multiple sugar transport system substrate-binding protein/sn-glycerol 3-phosphate transport system substrate-binding protein
MGMHRVLYAFTRPIHLIALFVFLSLLGACNLPAEEAVTGSLTPELTSSPPAPTSGVEATLPPTATEEPANPTPGSTLSVDSQRLGLQTVRLWHPWQNQPGQIMESLVNEFNASNEWGITVEARSFLDLDQLWQETIKTQAAGQAPDLAVGFGHQILGLDTVTPLVDMAEYINDPIWGLTRQDQTDFLPAFWEAGQAGERRLAFPALRSGQVLYYNESWAQELGFSAPPATPDELAEQACAAYQANLNDENPENDGTGGMIISTQYAGTLGWLKAFGASVVREDGDGYTLNTPQADQALRFLRDLYDQGCAWLPESDFAETEFAAREGLFYTGTVTGIPYQSEVMARQSNSDTWTVRPFPAAGSQPALPVFGPSFTLLPSTPEQQLAAWLFVRWLAQPENQARWIESTASLPLRSAALDFLDSYRQSHPQWAAAVEALPYAIAETELLSWAQVRWALQDATTQLYRAYFSADGIPEMLEFLQKTADDLHQDSLPSPK